MNCTTLESLRRILEEAPDTRFVEVSPELYATLIDADLLEHDPRSGIGSVLRDTHIEILQAGAAPDGNPLATPGHTPSFPEHIVYTPRSLAAACLLEASQAVAAIRHGYAPELIAIEGMYGVYRGASRLKHEPAHRRDIACSTLAVAMYWQQTYGLCDGHNRPLDKDFLRAEVLNGNHAREQEIFWEGDPMVQYFSPLMRDTILISHAEKLCEQLADRMPMILALTRALWRAQTPLQLPRLDKQAIITAVKPLLAFDHPLLKVGQDLDLFDLWAAQSEAHETTLPAALPSAEPEPYTATVILRQPEIETTAKLASASSQTTTAAAEIADASLLSRLRKVLRR